MSSIKEKSAERIFEVLKSHGFKIKVYDQLGNQTTEVSTASFFYVIDLKMMVSLNDSARYKTMSVHTSNSMDIFHHFKLLQLLRTTATYYGYNYILRPYAREIKPKDFKSLVEQHIKGGNKVSDFPELMQITKWANKFELENVLESDQLKREYDQLKEQYEDRKEEYQTKLASYQRAKLKETRLDNLAQFLVEHINEDEVYKSVLDNFSMNDIKNAVKRVESTWVSSTAKEIESKLSNILGGNNIFESKKKKVQMT